MEIPVKIAPDEGGYTGRECPTCEKYFKIKFGTGLPSASECHCPYCNHVGLQNVFWTKQQLEYARSVVLNQISGDLLQQMKRMERRPDPNAFISIGITVKGQPTPIAYYTESELEERLTCSSCTLEYAIYGAFGFCPDCGVHNSFQILNANFDLALKVLDLAKISADEIKSKLVENALEDVISSFDGFGREHCLNLPGKLSFQNIAATKEKLLRENGIDISLGLNTAQWSFVCEQFQKRHLLAHKMGVIDDDYASRTGTHPSLIGRKVVITESDVRILIENLQVVGQNLVKGVARS
ncbi:hypothetical protein [Geothrix fermentans]|uniref:hypothetical protein n=1 Tax=Geothrix fermentans TaxID=44676 RepID=UPI0012FA19CC|nr:hypothetical protein [Geothrix fermentans]